MRKLFRMKYEPCTGRCYAYSDVMRIHTLGLDARGAAEFLRRLVAVHEPSCGNEHLQFRLDVDEFTAVDYDLLHGERRVETQRFVASFYHYGALDLFAADTPREALDQMIDAALAYYASDQYREDLASRGPGLGHEVCEHGDDKKLVEFAIAFSGLSAAEQDALLEQFA